MYIDINDFVNSPKDTKDSIYHFQARVYYDIAKAMAKIIQQNSDNRVGVRSSNLVAFDVVLSFIKEIIVKISGGSKDGMMRFLSKVYRKLARKERR